MSGPLPAPFAEAVRRFNAGEYFAAHEAFEECLDAVEDDDRWELCLGLVQVAVGYHKATAGHPGAARMLGLGDAKLAALAPGAHGVDVAGLRARIAADLAAGDRAIAGRVAAAPPRLDVRG